MIQKHSQYADGHASRRRISQSFNQGVTKLIILQDIGFQQNLMFCRLDRVQNRTKRSVAICVDFDIACTVYWPSINSCNEPLELRVPHARRQGFGKSDHVLNSEMRRQLPPGLRTKRGFEPPSNVSLRRVETIGRGRDATIEFSLRSNFLLTELIWATHLGSAHERRELVPRSLSVFDFVCVSVHWLII